MGDCSPLRSLMHGLSVVRRSRSCLNWTGLVQRLCLAAREKIVFCPWMGNAHEDRDLEEDQYQEVI
jgi:hypothetical protein